MGFRRSHIESLARLVVVRVHLLERRDNRPRGRATDGRM